LDAIQTGGKESSAIGETEGGGEKPTFSPSLRRPGISAQGECFCGPGKHKEVSVVALKLKKKEKKFWSGVEGGLKL